MLAECSALQEAPVEGAVGEAEEERQGLCPLSVPKGILKGSRDSG